jgi:hypothetical protein
MSGGRGDTAAEGNASAGSAGTKGPGLGADILGFEVPDQFVDAGDFEIPAENQPDAFGFVLDHFEFALHQFIAKGERPTYPHALALGSRNLVPKRESVVPIQPGCKRDAGPGKVDNRPISRRQNLNSSTA